MRVLIALLLCLPLVALAGDSTTVVNQPAPPGTRGRVETETLLRMNMQLSSGGAAVPVEVETEQIHFWDFVVVSNEGGVATVDLHYSKAWVHTEAQNQVEDRVRHIQGRAYRVRAEHGVLVDIVERPSLAPVSDEVQQTIINDVDWIDELLSPTQHIGRLVPSTPYSNDRLDEFIGGLGEGATGKVSAYVRGKASAAGRPTVAIDWGAQAGWNDAGIDVTVMGEGVLHIDREYGIGTKLSFKGPLTLSGYKDVASGEGVVRAAVSGTGRLVLISRLELDPP